MNGGTHFSVLKAPPYRASVRNHELLLTPHRPAVLPGPRQPLQNTMENQERSSGREAAALLSRGVSLVAS